MRVKPFASFRPQAPTPRCRLLFGAGLAYGERGASEPTGHIAIWLISHRRLHQRMQEPDGSLREHYKLESYWCEVESGRKVYRLVLSPHRLPRFAVDST